MHLSFMVFFLVNLVVLTRTQRYNDSYRNFRFFTRHFFYSAHLCRPISSPTTCIIVVDRAIARKVFYSSVYCGRTSTERTRCNSHHTYFVCHKYATLIFVQENFEWQILTAEIVVIYFSSICLLPLVGSVLLLPRTDGPRESWCQSFRWFAISTAGTRRKCIVSLRNKINWHV